MSAIQVSHANAYALTKLRCRWRGETSMSDFKANFAVKPMGQCTEAPGQRRESPAALD